MGTSKEKVNKMNTSMTEDMLAKQTINDVWDKNLSVSELQEKLSIATEALKKIKSVRVLMPCKFSEHTNYLHAENGEKVYVKWADVQIIDP